MPMFDKKKEKRPETRKVSDIVFDMLANNVPEEKVIKTLLQSGVTEEEADSILSSSKKAYKDYVGTRLSSFVDQLVEQKKEEIARHIEGEVSAAKSEIFLQNDLKFMEQKQYTDNRVGDVRKEVDSLKDDVYSIRMDFNSKVGYLRSEIEGLRFKGMVRIMLSVFIMLAGVLIVAYFALNIMSYFNSEASFQQTLPYIGFFVLIIFVGLILLKLGIDIYFERQRHVEVGLDWMQKKEEKPAGKADIK